MLEVTPGPWEVTSTNAGSVALVYREGYLPYKAIRGSRDAAPREAVDNARLIAAAPKMLELLRNIVANDVSKTIVEAGNWLAEYGLLE